MSYNFKLSTIKTAKIQKQDDVTTLLIIDNEDKHYSFTLAPNDKVNLI